MEININGKDLLKKAIIAYWKWKDIDIETEKISIYINSDWDLAIDILDSYWEVIDWVILEYEDCEFTDEVVEDKLNFITEDMNFEEMEIEIEEEELDELG